MRYYLFSSSTETLKCLEMNFGFSYTNQEVVTVATPLELEMKNGQLFFKAPTDKEPGHTNIILMEENVECEIKDCPITRDTPYGKIGVNKLYIVQTKSGSVYAFMPEDAKYGVIAD